MEINTYIVDLPPKVKGFVVREDFDAYTIYINSRLNVEMQKETAEHEIRHIKRGDFESTVRVSQLEAYI